MDVNLGQGAFANRQPDRPHLDSPTRACAMGCGPSAQPRRSRRGPTLVFFAQHHHTGLFAHFDLTQKTVAQ